MTALKWILVFVLLIGSLALAVSLVDARNQIQQMRLEIDIAWADLERDLLKRRALLPKLIEGVRTSTLDTRQPALEQAISSLEREMLRVDAARDRQTLIEANLYLEQATQALIAELDARPGLQPDSRLSSPRDEVLALGNQIALHRTEYNEAVQRFNIRLALFPSNLAARVFGIERHSVYVPTTLTPGGGPGKLPVQKKWRATDRE